MYFNYALQRSLVAPMNLWASALHSFWSNPVLPVADTPWARALAASGEVMERATRRYAKPPFALETTTIDGRAVAVRERVVLDTPFCRLLHFEREIGREDPRVLLVAPLSGHHASLLRDTVATLLPHCDVWITDWVDARLVPVSEGGFDLDDYIDLCQRFLRAVGPGAHVVAVCQPGVPVLAAVALLAEDGDAAVPKTLTLMGAPVDARESPTAPGRLAATRSLGWFEATLVHRVPAGEPGFLRRVYPGFLQLSGFLAMNPVRHAQAHLDHFRNLFAGNEAGAQAHRRFYDDYLAVIDMPAEYYLMTISSVFQQHVLARGEMRYRGSRPVRPEAIRETALMTVEGEQDDITGIGQTFAAHKLCTSIPADRRHHRLQPGIGHYGLFSGRRWREEIAPALVGFIRNCG